MLITNIELENFGPHKSLKTSFSPGLVGLVGANSKGKTTLLRAIEFALTGSLPDNAESYVRKTVGDPVSNATVVLEFTKNGAPGTIMRRVGKSPKRELTWGGQTFKKTEDIDRTLAEVLNADKQAISSAIFLAQGDIGRLLFAPLSTRETLFQRLLLVGYMGAIETAIDAQSKVLSSSIVDFSVVLDEVRAQQVSAKEAIDAHSQTTCPVDLSEYLESLSVVKTRLYEYFTESKRFDQYVEDSKSQNEADALKLSQYKDILTSLQETTPILLVGDPTKCIAEGLTALGDSCLKIGYKVQQQEKCENNERLLTQLESERSELIEAIARLTAEDNKIPNTINEMVQTKLQFDTLTKQCLSFTHTLSNLEIELEDHKKREIALVDAQKQLELHTAEQNRYSAQLEFVVSQLLFLDAIKELRDDHATCPFCLGAVTGNHVPNVEELQKSHKLLRDSVIREHSEISKITSYIKTSADGFANVLREESVARANLLKAQTELTNLVLNDFVLDHTVEELQALSVKKIETTVLLNSANSKLGLLLPTLTNCTLFKQNNYSDENLQELKAQEQELHRKKTELLAFSNSYNNILSAISFVQLSIKKAQDTTNSFVASSNNALISYLNSKNKLRGTMMLSNTPSYKDTSELENLNSQIAAIDATQKEIVVYTTKAKMLEEQLSALDRREAAVKVSQLAQGATRQIIEELQLLKHTFSKSGLPGLYVADRFSRLTAITNTNLSCMQANFSVRASLNEPLAFEFIRNDLPDVAWLDQGKLSGGQRVRLAVAFLTAVQQLVIPDVGLLVMDEPSTHLDAESVDSMRELLHNMSGQFKARDAQIIVCDHNPRLIPFDCPVVDLSR